MKEQTIGEILRQEAEQMVLPPPLCSRIDAALLREGRKALAEGEPTFFVSFDDVAELLKTKVASYIKSHGIQILSSGPYYADLNGTPGLSFSCSFYHP